MTKRRSSSERLRSAGPSGARAVKGGAGVASSEREERRDVEVDAKVASDDEAAFLERASAPSRPERRTRGEGRAGVASSEREERRFVQLATFAQELVGRKLRVPSDEGKRLSDDEEHRHDAALKQLGPDGLLVERECRVELRELIRRDR